MFGAFVILFAIIAVVIAIWFSVETQRQGLIAIRAAHAARLDALQIVKESNQKSVIAQQQCMRQVQDTQDQQDSLMQEATNIYRAALATRSKTDALSASYDAIPKVRQSLEYATMNPISQQYADSITIDSQGRLVYQAARPWEAVTEAFIVGSSVEKSSCMAEESCASMVNSATNKPAAWSHVVMSQVANAPCNSSTCLGPLMASFDSKEFSRVCASASEACSLRFTQTSAIPVEVRRSVADAYTQFRTLLYAKVLDGVDLSRTDVGNVLLQNFHVDDRAYLKSLNVFLQDGEVVTVSRGGVTSTVRLIGGAVSFHAAVMAIVLRYITYGMQIPYMKVDDMGV